MANKRLAPSAVACVPAIANTAITPRIFFQGGHGRFAPAGDMAA